MPTLHLRQEDEEKNTKSEEKHDSVELRGRKRCCFVWKYVTLYIAMVSIESTSSETGEQDGRGDADDEVINKKITRKCRINILTFT